jgi:hypothetical protein
MLSLPLGSGSGRRGSGPPYRAPPRLGISGGPVFRYGAATPQGSYSLRAGRYSGRPLSRAGGH